MHFDQNNSSQNVPVSRETRIISVLRSLVCELRYFFSSNSTDKNIVQEFFSINICIFKRTTQRSADMRDVKRQQHFFAFQIECHAHDVLAIPLYIRTTRNGNDRNDLEIWQDFRAEKHKTRFSLNWSDFSPQQIARSRMHSNRSRSRALDTSSAAIRIRERSKMTLMRLLNFLWSLLINRGDDAMWQMLNGNCPALFWLSCVLISDDFDCLEAEKALSAQNRWRFFVGFGKCVKNSYFFRRQCNVKRRKVDTSFWIRGRPRNTERRRFIIFPLTLENIAPSCNPEMSRKSTSVFLCVCWQLAHQLIF